MQQLVCKMDTIALHLHRMCDQWKVDTAVQHLVWMQVTINNWGKL